MASSTFNLDSFLEYLLGLSSQLHRHYNTDDLNLAENLLFRAEDCISVLRVILGRVSENNHTPQEIIGDIEYIIGEFQRLCSHYGEWTLQMQPDPSNFLNRHPSCQRTGHPGRPSYHICKEDLESLLELGFNFHQMSMILGVSERTIRRRRELFGLGVGNNFTEISNEELDDIISNILQVILITTGLLYNKSVWKG